MSYDDLEFAAESIPDDAEERFYALLLGPDSARFGPAVERLAAERPEAAIGLLQRLEWFASPRYARGEGADMLRRLRGIWSVPRHSERYEFVEELASGAFGSVHVLKDRLLRRKVACKIIRSQLGGTLAAIEPEYVHRFLDEAQIAAQLNHPSIPAVHDIGVDNLGVPFFTMRLVRGLNLHAIVEAHLQGEPAWTLRRVVRILVEVCKVLDYAHSRDVLHLDLKPANIKVGRFGEVCVIDWGLSKARRADSLLGSTSEVALDRKVRLQEHARGTRGYTAPEQWHGELHQAGDIFSVGAILHHALAGAKPPITGGSTSYELPAAAREKDAGLSDICARAMAVRPEDRHASAADLLADLQAHLAPPKRHEGWRTRLARALRWTRSAPASTPVGADAAMQAVQAALAGEQGLESGMAPRLIDEAFQRGASGNSAGRMLLEQALEALPARLALVDAHGMDPRRLSLGSALARGAQAEIVAAEDLALRRPMAVKRLATGPAPAPETGAPGMMQLALFDEAQIAAQLDHPSVLSPHDLARDSDGRLLLVLPLASEGTLHSLHAALGPQGWRTTVPLLLKAAQGLAYAHEKGVVHRDVKALNILLGKHGDAYLGDWGLAILTGDDRYGESSIRVERGAGMAPDAAVRRNEEEDEGSRAGTPLYMSPEQAAGGTVGPASDVYSLGLVLLELLCGWRRSGRTRAELLRAAVQGAPPPVRKVLARVPEALESVCLRALQPLPEDRFEDAGGFAVALGEALDKAS